MFGLKGQFRFDSGSKTGQMEVKENERIGISATIIDCAFLF